MSCAGALILHWRYLQPSGPHWRPWPAIMELNLTVPLEIFANRSFQQPWNEEDMNNWEQSAPTQTQKSSSNMKMESSDSHGSQEGDEPTAEQTAHEPATTEQMTYEVTRTSSCPHQSSLTNSQQVDSLQLQTSWISYPPNWLGSMELTPDQISVCYDFFHLPPIGIANGRTVFFYTQEIFFPLDYNVDM